MRWSMAERSPSSTVARVSGGGKSVSTTWTCIFSRSGALLYVSRACTSPLVFAYEYGAIDGVHHTSYWSNAKDLSAISASPLPRRQKPTLVELWRIGMVASPG